jgi:hypothetical protein
LALPALIGRAVVLDDYLEILQERQVPYNGNGG